MTGTCESDPVIKTGVLRVAINPTIYIGSCHVYMQRRHVCTRVCVIVCVMVCVIVCVIVCVRATHIFPRMVIKDVK